MGKSQDYVRRAHAEISRGIVGQKDFIDGVMLAILAGGHVLVESVPGLAKTRAVKLLAGVCGLSFSRIQFTPDLLPADIVGTRVYNQSTSLFETRKGPIFANFILADEINRAPAKVQSALLEAMQERQVTIGNETFMVPEPFFVFATQNPVEQEGTYRLPEAQLDRFFMKLNLDYPDIENEISIMEMVMNETSLPPVEAVLPESGILYLQEETRRINIDSALLKYIAEIVAATRDVADSIPGLAGKIEYGASPRASIALARAAKARALVNGRNSVIPEDIKRCAYPVLRHRIILTYLAEAERVMCDEIIGAILASVKVP